MQEPILVPGPQLQKSKDKKATKRATQAPIQTATKKNKRPRKNPTLLQAQNCNQDSARKKSQDHKKYSNQSHNDHANPGAGNTPLLDKTIVLGPQNEVKKAYQKLAPSAGSSPVPASTSILLGDDVFQRHAAKKHGQCGPQNGAQNLDPVLGAAKEKTFRRTPKRGPDFTPHFKVHIAHVFPSATPEKSHVV